jgi:Fe-S cluster biogenesis protein NfuA
MQDNLTQIAAELSEENLELLNKIRVLFDQDVRPYLNSHGGDVEIVSFNNERNLQIRLHGACGACPASSVTLYYVVEEALECEFPDDEITVEQVD